MREVLPRFNRQNVHPSQIDADQSFFGLFDSVETAMTAKVILLLSQEGEGWVWLPGKDIEARCRQLRYPVKLTELVEAGDLQKNADADLYLPSHQFVMTCYWGRPVIGTQAPQDGAQPA